MRSAWRRAAAIFSLLAVVFYWKILLTKQFALLLDVEGVNQAYAWLSFWVHSIRSGTYPLWDPYFWAGQPFAGEMQTGAFNPLHLFFVIYPLNSQGLISPFTYHIFYVLIHILGALFMYCLVRDLGLSFFAGIVAGICFSFGGVTANIASWPHIYESCIWLPLVVLFLRRALNSERLPERLAQSVFAGACIGMGVLAGGLHMVIMQGVVTIVMVVFHALCETDQALPAKTRRRWAITVLLTTGGAAATAGAVQLLASAEYAARAYRWIGGPMLPADRKIPFAYLGDGIWPFQFFSFLIPVGKTSLGPGEVLGCYFGVIGVMLAAAGIWRGWGERWVRFAVILAVGSYLYAVAPSSLLRDFLLAAVPYLWMQREAARYLYVLQFAASILIAYGVGALFARPFLPDSWQPALRIIKWVALVSGGMLASVVVFPKDVDPWSSTSWFLILTACGLAAYLVRGNPSTRVAQVLIVGFLLFDIYSFDWAAKNLILEHAKGPNYMERLLNLKPTAEFLQKQSGVFRVQFDIDGPNLGDFYRIETMSGRGVSMLRNFEQTRGTRNLWNIRYIVRPASASDPDPIYQDSESKIYEIPAAPPRVWLVHQVEVQASRDDLLRRLVSESFSPQNLALVERPLQEALRPPSLPPSVTLTGYDARHPHADVDVDVPALMVFSEMYYPGWSATVNGKTAEIVEVNGSLRGVMVPAGRSRVEMRYRSATAIIGGSLSVATYVGVMVLIFLRRMGRFGGSIHPRSSEPTPGS